MSNREELLKKLSPGSMSLEPRIDGGSADITWQDVCAALSTLPESASNYARLKHELMDDNRHEAYFLKVYHTLKHETEALGVDWDVQKLNSVVKLVLLQEISPNICPNCKGTAHRLIDDKDHACFMCRGTGRTKLTQKICGEYIGVTEQSYRKVWKNRANRVYGLISDWEYLINRAIKINV